VCGTCDEHAVTSATVNLLGEKATVAFDRAAVSPEVIVAAIQVA